MTGHPRNGYTPAECAELSDALGFIWAEVIGLVGSDTKSKTWPALADAAWSQRAGHPECRAILRVGGSEWTIAPHMAREYHRRLFGVEPGRLLAKWRAPYVAREPYALAIADRHPSGWLNGWKEVAPAAPAVAIEAGPAPRETGVAPKTRTPRRPARRTPKPAPPVYRAALRSYLDRAA